MSKAGSKGAERTHSMDALIKLDGDILLWIQDNLRTGWLDPIMKFITSLGNAGILWIALCILMIIFKKTRQTGIVSACSLAAAFTINNLIIKNVVARTRPYEAIEALNRIVSAQSDYSFPSGHTTASFAVAVVMFMELPKKYGVPALIMAFLIAFSRLYVGVHYPSDVIVGMITATIYAIIAVTIYRKCFNKDKAADNKQDE